MAEKRTAKPAGFAGFPICTRVLDKDQELILAWSLKNEKLTGTAGFFFLSEGASSLASRSAERKGNQPQVGSFSFRLRERQENGTM